jgi:hypothetical protein
MLLLYDADQEPGSSFTLRLYCSVPGALLDIEYMMSHVARGSIGELKVDATSRRARSAVYCGDLMKRTRRRSSTG